MKVRSLNEGHMLSLNMMGWLRPFSVPVIHVSFRLPREHREGPGEHKEYRFRVAGAGTVVKGKVL